MAYPTVNSLMKLWKKLQIPWDPRASCSAPQNSTAALRDSNNSTMQKKVTSYCGSRSAPLPVGLSPTATDCTFVTYAGPYLKIKQKTAQQLYHFKVDRHGEKVWVNFSLTEKEGREEGGGEHDYYQLGTPPSSLYITLFVSGGGGEKREEGKRSGIDGGSIAGGQKWFSDRCNGGVWVVGVVAEP
ncbi:hypothetical protein K438DRAFT_1763679 [Mycena galopus ATCC 62051]|nr:hypothetical protein K438DRAFT_1763679 [Mycena galopus ATCC 62051]